MTVGWVTKYHFSLPTFYFKNLGTDVKRKTVISKSTLEALILSRLVCSNEQP